jgi:hypothetical protein
MDDKDLRKSLDARAGQTGGHDQAALLCEQRNLPDLAEREWALALRDNPRHSQALRRLADAALERGDATRARELLETLLKTSPSDADARALLASLEPPARPAPAPPKEPPPAEEDLARLLDLFQGREDVYARQWCDAGGRNGYSPVPQPLTPAALRNHLLGNATVGVYVIRLDSTVKFLALDLDIGKRALEEAAGLPERAAALRTAVNDAGLRLYRELNGLGLPPLLEDSGYKGRHLWILLDPPLPAARAFELGQRLVARLQPALPPELHIEFFPKQPSAGTGPRGLGNLIKLPLGIHRRSGRRSRFLDEGGRPVEDWRALLGTAPRLSPEDLDRAFGRLGVAAPVAEPPPSDRPEPPPLPAPPPPAPPWSDSDFERHPEVARLIRGCPVLAALVRQVRETRALSRDEQVVVAQALGRTPGGVAAVNYLFGRCPDVGKESLLKSPLAGNPISCAAIRRRLPHVAGRVDCSCDFPRKPSSYPTPVLHLEDAPPPPAAPAAESDEEVARRHAACAARLREVSGEEKRLRLALVERLRARPERSLALPEGRLSVREAGGVEELVWEPAK